MTALRPAVALLTMIDRFSISGLVMAGGRGSRMGGVDKGLQSLHGTPLAVWAARRLAPQVDKVMLNANRHVADYAAWGYPVASDADAASFAGPLAGFLSGLERCDTPYLATVPCDTPRFPTDLVARLSTALVLSDADVAMASSGVGERTTQPAFCLIKRELGASIASYLQAGGRKVETWIRQQRFAVADFDDTTAFFNANTPDDLDRLRHSAAC